MEDSDLLTSLDDQLRARRIVELAVAKKSSASNWLDWDERGTWELAARRLWRETAHKRAEFGMHDAVAEQQIADYIVLQALTAMLEFAKKKGKGKK